MKALLTALAVLVIALPVLGQSKSTGGVDMAYDKTQPNERTPAGQLSTYALAPGKACTTMTYLVGNKGGFSCQFACSLKATGDSGMIAMYSQYAHYDVNKAFNAHGIDSLIGGKVDTVLKTSVSAWPNWYWSYNYDYTSTPTRALYERTIIYNYSTTDSAWVRFFPLKSLDAH